MKTKTMLKHFPYVEVHVRTKMLLDNGQSHEFYQYDERKELSSYVRQLVASFHRDSRIKIVKIDVHEPIDGLCIACRVWKKGE